VEFMPSETEGFAWLTTATGIMNLVDCFFGEKSYFIQFVLLNSEKLPTM
jgi:hypothetical protein